jgi:hypothetical protein
MKGVIDKARDHCEEDEVSQPHLRRSILVAEH